VPPPRSNAWDTTAAIPERGFHVSEHLDRQPAAVMFADVVGFTALMQEDEHLGVQQGACQVPTGA
jgi:class 3 adenylate cyclase